MELFLTGFADQARVHKAEEARKMGIDDDLISILVDKFYDKIRTHHTLGPIFAKRVSEWPTHLGRMKAFWGSVAIESGRFHGNPLLKHIAIGELQPEHFSEWLSLWSATVKDVVADDKALDFFNNRANRIAESLIIGIALHRDRSSIANL